MIYSFKTLQKKEIVIYKKVLVESEKATSSDNTVNRNIYRAEHLIGT